MPSQTLPLGKTVQSRISLIVDCKNKVNGWKDLYADGKEAHSVMNFGPTVAVEA